MLPSYTMSFDGALLNRGFWLYIWDIRGPKGRYLYVGRTGDSSSPNASSPFRRIGQHLDFSENAKANAMARQLMHVNVSPADCTFEMTAVGPLFPEQKNWDKHQVHRDRTAGLEKAIAVTLNGRGYTVLGSHGSQSDLDMKLFSEVLEILDRKFPLMQLP
ncbi:MAG: hypothetical protein RRA94_03930 [Bacteroidota bacterium]|nr:hypothetical protein [Bacteroidota bacterium]